MSELADAVTKVLNADGALNAMAPTPFPLPIQGLESVVAGAVLALKRTDWWVPGLRERAGAVLRDVPLERLVDGFAGAKPYKVAPPSGSPALRALTAVGLAMAQDTGCALVHLGTGSLSDGAFTEALNTAALNNAPVIFVVATTPLTDDAPIGPQSTVDLKTLAKAYGITYARVDGRKAKSVHTAVGKARDAGGPTLIEAKR